MRPSPMCQCRSRLAPSGTSVSLKWKSKMRVDADFPFGRIEKAIDAVLGVDRVARGPRMCGVEADAKLWMSEAPDEGAEFFERPTH